MMNVFKKLTLANSLNILFCFWASNAFGADQPIFETLEPPHFEATDHSNISSFLEENGFVVIKNLIDSKQIQALFRQDLETINPKLQHKREQSLWSFQSSVDYPKAVIPGLIGEWGLSHGNAAWSVRTNQTIQQQFANALKEDIQNLVVSNDAIGFSPDTDASDNETWLHVDQVPHVMPGGALQSLQGIVYAEDSTTDSATTVVAPGSHYDWRKHDYTSRNHFQLVDQQHYIPKSKRLLIKAGSLLLFNSRLVHQGWRGPHRLCFMVSFGKKSDRSEAARQRKVMMYLMGQRSTHWSQFGKAHGKKMVDVTAPYLGSLDMPKITSTPAPKQWSLFACCKKTSATSPFLSEDLPEHFNELETIWLDQLFNNQFSYFYEKRKHTLDHSSIKKISDFIRHIETHYDNTSHSKLINFARSLLRILNRHEMQFGTSDWETVRPFNVKNNTAYALSDMYTQWLEMENFTTTPWSCLKPKLLEVKTSTLTSAAKSLVDEPTFDDTLYQIEFDAFIPNDRLSLF